MAGMLAVSTMVYVAGCGQLAGPASSSGLRVASSLTAKISVPAGYSPIQGMVGNPAGAGAWFWDYGKSADTVFFDPPDGALRSWNVLSGPSYQAPQAQSGLAVGPDGDVWLGINSTLAQLSPRNGAVRTWHIPASRADASALRGVQRLQAVQSIAVSPADDVAVAMSNSSSVQIFDARTRAFSDIDMPAASTMPVAVDYSGDGTLAIGLSDSAHGGKANEVALLTSAGSTASALTSTPGSAWEISTLTQSEFLVGAIHPEIVNQSGAVTSLNTPALTGSAIAPDPIIAQPDGMLVGISASGIVDFRDGASSVRSAVRSSTTLAGTRTCGVSAPSVVGSHGHIKAPGRKCGFTTYAFVAADATGKLWVIPPGSGDSVALLSRA